MMLLMMTMLMMTMMKPSCCSDQLVDTGEPFLVCGYPRNCYHTYSQDCNRYIKFGKTKNRLLQLISNILEIATTPIPLTATDISNLVKLKTDIKYPWSCCHTYSPAVTDISNMLQIWKYIATTDIKYCTQILLPYNLSNIVQIKWSDVGPHCWYYL